MFNVITDHQSFIERLYSKKPRRIVLESAFLKEGSLITVHEDLNEDLDEENPAKETLSGRKIIYEVIEERFLLHSNFHEYYVKELSRENVVPIPKELKEEINSLKERINHVLDDLKVFCDKNHCEITYNRGDFVHMTVQEVNTPINMEEYEKRLQVESLDDIFRGNWYYSYDQN